VKELRTRNAENTAVGQNSRRKKKKGLTKAVPAIIKIQDFIAQAKELAPLIKPPFNIINKYLFI